MLKIKIFAQAPVATNRNFKLLCGAFRVLPNIAAQGALC
jgi:hypothetical protein